MDKPKKPYVKPTMTIHPAGSPKYKEIMALLEAEKEKPLSYQQTGNFKQPV